jgi:hypothetical protein
MNEQAGGNNNIILLLKRRAKGLHKVTPAQEVSDKYINDEDKENVRGYNDGRPKKPPKHAWPENEEKLPVRSRTKAWADTCGDLIRKIKQNIKYEDTVDNEKIITDIAIKILESKINGAEFPMFINDDDIQHIFSTCRHHLADKPIPGLTDEQIEPVVRSILQPKPNHSMKAGGGKKITFYKKVDGKSKTFSRVVQLNKRGTECVKYNGELIPVSKLRLEPYAKAKAK